MKIFWVVTCCMICMIHCQIVIIFIICHNTEMIGFGLVYGVKRHFQQYFSYIVAVSFIGGGNRSTPKNHRPVARH